MFENEKKFLLLVAMPVVDESQKQEIVRLFQENINFDYVCLLYTSPSPRD